LCHEFKPIFIASRWPNNTKLFDEYKVLAPKPKLIGGYIRGEINETEYTKQFTKMLADVKIEQVVSDINKICGPKFPVLICYEAPDKFCHRHLVRQWFLDNGVQSEEYNATTSFFYF
jgi:hypothetical protein